MVWTSLTKINDQIIQTRHYDFILTYKIKIMFVLIDLQLQNIW